MINCASPIMCGTSLLHQNELALPVGLNEFFVFFLAGSPCSNDGTPRKDAKEGE